MGEDERGVEVGGRRIEGAKRWQRPSLRKVLLRFQEWGKKNRVLSDEKIE